MIYLTGANGHIGTKLFHSLAPHFSICKMARENGNIKWSLGEVPNLLRLNQEDVLIHLGWSLRDRKNDFALNVGGSQVISEYFKSNGARVLFVSSVSAGSDSHYGEQKFEAEKVLKDLNCSILRIGMIPVLNRYDHGALKIFGFNCEINVTEYDDFIQCVLSYLESKDDGRNFEIVSRRSQYRELFKSAKFRFTPKVFRWQGARIYTKYRTVNNILDAMYNLSTTNLRL